MSCNEYLPLLSGHLDGTNSEAEESRLQKHLASCKQCRRLLAQLEQTDALLLSAKAEPPADLAARIMSQVRNEPKRKKALHRTVRSVCAAGFAAAALLALVFFGDLKLPSLKPEGSADAAYSDAGSGQSASGDWTEEADFLFRNDEMTAEQAENYSITRDYGANAPDTAAAPSIESVTEKGNSLTATESAESLLTLPSLSYDAGGELLNDYESAEDSGTTHRLPYGLTTSEAASPLLVIRGAQAEELSLLYGLSPSEENMTTSSDEADDLYTRLLSALSPQQDSAPTITKYLVSYEQFSSIFNDYVGIYETAVYYPAELYDLESCTVLVISDAQPTE
ncbi:MAG: zf-HC2 domain-containing protein [Faecousia sp.]